MAKSIVYKYHCEPASPEDDDLLRSQIRLSAEYRRELATIENLGRAIRRSAQAIIGRERPDPAVDALVRETRDLDPIRRISDLQSRGMSREIAEATILRDRAMLAQSAAARAARAAAVRAGLHWGTYQDAEEAFSASCRTTPLFDDVRAHSPRAVGCAAVHLQPARPLFDEDDWVRVGGMARRGSEIDRSGRVRPTRHRQVLLRVGSLEDRSPRWATLLVLMHRPLPEGGVVSWARAKRRLIGAMARWELHVTVTVPEGAGARRGRPASAGPGSVVGVDIGWRQMGDRVRIAFWSGSDGRFGETSISNYVLGADAKADSLRAIRDRLKNEIREQIRSWAVELRERSRVLGEPDPWIVEEVSSIHAWLKTWRFVRLAARWRAERIPGDDEIHQLLSAFLKQDRHLWNWEAASRQKRKRRVDEQIRLLAVRLGREYERVGIEAPIVARLMRRPERCDACRELPARCDDCRQAERMRRIASTRVPHAAPARTRQEIKTFSAGYGAVVVELDPAHTTTDCAGCGHRRDDVEDWSPLEITCSRCGLTEDQDSTAARNLARAAAAASIGPDGRPLQEARAGKRKLGVRRNRRVARPAAEPGGETEAD